jgi:hypothetical protein
MGIGMGFVIGPDILFYDFGALFDVYKDAFADRSASDQSDLFFDTARGVYRH